MTIDELAAALEGVYAADTSADPDQWSQQNPTHGHCAVVSLLVMDHFGGTLLRTTVGGVSHYFNRLEDGSEVDLTREQFASWEPTEVVERERKYVLSFGPTATRYQLLLERLKRAA